MFYGSCWINLLERNKILPSPPNSKDTSLEKFNNTLYDTKSLKNNKFICISEKYSDRNSLCQIILSKCFEGDVICMSHKANKSLKKRHLNNGQYKRKPWHIQPVLVYTELYITAVGLARWSRNDWRARLHCDSNYRALGLVTDVQILK